MALLLACSLIVLGLSMLSKIRNADYEKTHELFLILHFQLGELIRNARFMISEADRTSYALDALETLIRSSETQNKALRDALDEDRLSDSKSRRMTNRNIKLILDYFDQRINTLLTIAESENWSPTYVECLKDLLK